MRNVLKLFGFIFCLIFCNFSFSQIAPSAAPADTVREIQILEGRSLRNITIDSITQLQTIAGKVLLKEGTTKFYCDSAVINKRLNTIEAFGNIHINQADSIQTYCQYLKYLGNERMAYLKKSVRLTDKKGVLLTEDLDYDMKAGIGRYHNGGKVINGTTTLTSKEGIYYADTKDVFFKTNVDLIDPKNKIKADSMMYNMQTQLATFTGRTHIKNKDADIFTTQGTYDLKTGNSFFAERTLVKDSSGRTYQANTMAMDNATGLGQMEGNAVIRDSAGGFILTGNQIFTNQKNSSFLATRKPVLIIIQGKDSTYISADTLVSGIEKNIKKLDKISLGDSARKDQPKTKLALLTVKDSIKTDTTKNNIALNLTDSLSKDSIKIFSFKKEFNQKDTVKKTKIIAVKSTDTTLRSFNAFHNVKIFNDSLQSVCDSLYYSSEDSVFRLFQKPVVWTSKNQITGDTIYLFTKNKKAQRLYVFENAIIINETTSQRYNQIAGKNINGYFKDGEIDYMRVKGSKAESIYYVQDNDSSFVGMNRATGDVIDLYFEKHDLKKVLFVNEVHGKMYPMKQATPDLRYLKNFSWQDKRRPKNKLELFE